LEPLLPERVHQRIGRPRVDDRIAFTAILFVLVTGVPWRVLPREIGCSGVTAWRRLCDWQAAGVWVRLHREMLRRLNALGQVDWSTGVVDASHIRALRTGSKHHLIVERHGVPLTATLTGGHQWRPASRSQRMRSRRKLCNALLSLGCSLICWRHIRP